jgi:putative peptidoglycan lipid II flippase
MISRLIRTESYKKGMWLSVAFNIIAKAVLFGLTILIAKFFGSDIRTDIYFFIYGSMVLLSGFINTIDTMVLVPVSMQLREKEGDAAAMRFLNFFMRIYIFIGSVFVAIVYFFGARLFSSFSQFPATAILLYKDYFLLGSFYFLFMVLTNYINAILFSLKFFTVPMIISAINSCIVIGCILLLHRQYDVEAVLIGGITAYCINIILLLVLMKRNGGWDFLTANPSITKRTWSNIFFAELGQTATFASSFLPLYLLSGFGKGIISIMNYGKNIADIPNTLITAQLTNVTGVQLNEQAARTDGTGMNTTFLRDGRLLLFILLPVSCYLFVFAEGVTRVFYFRGNFTEPDVLNAARFLRSFSLVIFSIGINALVSRIFIAMQAIRQAFLYQVLLNLLLIAAMLMLTRYYGPWGYPYAVVLVNGINYLLMLFICKKIAPWINYGAILLYSLVLLLINAAVAAALWFTLPYLPENIWVKLLTGFFVYLFVLFLLYKKFLLAPFREAA